MSELDQYISALKELERRGFYGSVSVEFKGGKVTGWTTEETFKPRPPFDDVKINRQ